MTAYDAAVKKFVSDKFGSDLKSLTKIESIYSDVLKRKKDLEKQLSFVANDEPTKIEVSIDSTRSKLEVAEELQQTKQQVEGEVTQYLNETQDGADKYETAIRELTVVNKCNSYLRWIAKVEETSSSIQQLILSDSLKEACQTFSQLCTISSDLLKQETKCDNLTSFVTKTIMFWHTILQDRLSSDLDVVLKQISWPFVSGPGPKKILRADSNTLEKSAPSPFATPDPASGLEAVISCLLCIELPLHLRSNDGQNKLSSANEDNHEPVSEDKLNEHYNETLTVDEDSEYILLPFKLLLKPLRKRFKYHFVGDKPTNSIQKPEWYLSQVLNWVGNHAGFLEHTMQEILDSNQYQHVDALVMFTRGLLELVNEKLTNDMNEVIYMDELFMHTVDEVLLFHRELATAYSIPESMLNVTSPLNILTQPQCLIKWLNIEKMCALERLDSLLSEDDAWKTKFEENDDSDEMKTPQCAEAFISLLLTITDRYKSLPNNAGQLRFLDLQLLLLDDFRIRLTQMIRSIGRNQFDEVRFTILNAAYYITLVLQEWADNVFFLQLKYYKDQLDTQISIASQDQQSGTDQPVPEASTDDTVFEGTIRLYERICSEGVNDFVQVVATEFGLKSHVYAFDDWPSMPPPGDQVSMLVSRSACSMLEVVQDRLFLFEESLCRTLFNRVWHGIAEYIDDHLFKEVVMKNRFNAGGASQFNFDMQRNLFPLFRAYTNKPENYFKSDVPIVNVTEYFKKSLQKKDWDRLLKRVKESCVLINLQPGSALLLQEVLGAEEQEGREQEPVAMETSGQKTNPVQVLSDMGVFLLKPKDAARVLRRRIDWLNDL